MGRYILLKLGSFLATLCVAAFLIFTLLELLPGDVARYMMGLNADPSAMAALRTELGLDQPFLLRFSKWIGGILQGDFGNSYTYKVPVSSLLVKALAVSAPLALYAFILTLALSIPLAVWLVQHREGVLSLWLRAMIQLGVAIPNFWLGLILLWLFAISWHVFPAGGFAGWDAGIGAALWSLTLPAFALALPQVAILVRLLRSALLEAMGQDYVRTARAKGLTMRQAVRRHALPMALLSALPIIGLQLAFLITGAVIIENVFYVQGLGRLVFQAVSQRDLITVRGAALLLVMIVILSSFVTDILAAILDPRRRVG